MSSKLSEARQRLADAQQDLQAAAEEAGAANEHHQKILSVQERHRSLQAQLDAAQTSHSQALVEWAANGAQGDAPAAPAMIERLAKEVATAARAAEAADEAARQHQAKVNASREASTSALQRLREARKAVLLDAAQPLIAEYRGAVCRAHALQEHIFGLQAIADTLKDEVPGVGQVTFEIGKAMRCAPELTPGGAERSRQAWRDFIVALFDDPAAQLGDGPDAFDADERLRQRAA